MYVKEYVTRVTLRVLKIPKLANSRESLRFAEIGFRIQISYAMKRAALAQLTSSSGAPRKVMKNRKVENSKLLTLAVTVN